MSTRILRDARGYARKGPTQVIRTKPHVCGRSCPFHDEPLPAAMPKKRRKARGDA